MRYLKFISLIILFPPGNYCRGQADVNVDSSDLHKNEYLSPLLLDSLIKELVIIDTEDQKYRNQVDYVQSHYGDDSKELETLMRSMKETDSINLIKVEAMISAYGWLSSNLIGNDGNTTLFMVIQHSDIKTQQKYLSIVRDAVKKGSAKASHLALLEDRVALLLGDQQIYGSQISWNKKTDKYYVAPLFDPDNVDKRRREVGLPPIADYLLEMGIVWDVEEYKKELLFIEAEFFKKNN